MRSYACIILILQLLSVSVAHALDIQLNNPPGDYNIYKWSGKTVTHAGIMSADVKRFQFTIPDEYIVKKDGKVNIASSLRKWRKSTPAAEGHPRTKGGIGYYPFKDSNGNQYYVALEYLNDRIGRYNGTTITVNGEAPAPGDDDHKPPVTIAEGGDDSSEIVGGGTKPEDVAPADTSDVYDLNGCSYRMTCWTDKTLSEKIKAIAANVARVNQLHGKGLNPRFLMCMGWRESTFNPGALGGVKEKGMFQVRPSTGKAALRYGPLVPGFKSMSADNYMKNMVNSTLAQTELTFLTLKMKVAEGAPSSPLNGNGSVADYKALAKRYNGGGRKATRYANAIGSCYECLLNAMPSTSSFSESGVGRCLAKAKGK